MSIIHYKDIVSKCGVFLRFSSNRTERSPQHVKPSSEGRLRVLHAISACVRQRLVAAECFYDDDKKDKENQDGSDVVECAAYITATCTCDRVVMVSSARNVCCIIHEVFSSFNVKVQYPMYISPDCIGV
jgi:hypothetical protein